MTRLRQPMFRFWMSWLCLLGVVFSSPEVQGAIRPATSTVTASLGLMSAGQSPIVEYVRGPDQGGGVGGMLYSLRGSVGGNGGGGSGSTIKFSHSNGRGDVVAQTGASGSLTWAASYEAFGKRPVEVGTNLDRQRANTKE